MNLNEILNTKVDINWKSTNNGFSGTFELDKKHYEIVLDEYDVNLSKKISLIDFGFKAGGSWNLTNDHRAPKVIGAVLNGLIKKLGELKPDCLMFGINNKNGSIKSRASLYERIGGLYLKGSTFIFESDWIKTKNGQYKILSKIKFSNEDEKIINDLASSIELKD